MSGYINDALHKLKHLHPKLLQDAPHSWTQPAYDAKVHYTDNIDNTPAFPPKTVRLVQQIVGALLYYAIAVNITMLAALGSIAATQSQDTNNTYDKTLWLFNYATTHRDATICYSTSIMILHVHSDASYFSKSKARSLSGRHYFLRSRFPDPSKSPPSPPPPNRPLFTLSKIMRNVIASASKAKIGVTYINGQEYMPICTTLANS